MNDNPLFPEHQKNVTIHAKWTQGKWVSIFDTEFPELQEGAVADIIVPEYALVRPEEKAQYTFETDVTIFKPGTTVFGAIAPSPHTKQKVGDGIPQNIETNRYFPPGKHCYTPFVLLDELCLHFHGLRHATLKGCAVQLPEFSDEVVQSLNQALTRFAILTDQNRRSFSANAFEQIWFIDEETNQFLPLKLIRERHAAEIEKEVFVNQRPPTNC